MNIGREVTEASTPATVISLSLKTMTRHLLTNVLLAPTTATTLRETGSMTKIMEDGRIQAEAGTEMAFRMPQLPTVTGLGCGRLKVGHQEEMAAIAATSFLCT